MKNFSGRLGLTLAAVLGIVLAGCGGAGRDWLGNASHKGPPPVSLGHAGHYVVFANTAISNATPPAAITGNMAVGPGVTSTAITGFALSWTSGNNFATSAQVVGKVYAVDFAPPTPSDLTVASTNMATAYADAAGRTDPNFTDLASGNLGGLTLVPGLYKWSTGVAVAPGTTLTLSGGSNDVWILQVSGTLNAGSACNVVLTGGARPQNVIWQVGGASATIAANAIFRGIILADGAINVGSNASVTGRLLSNTTVSMDQSTVSEH